MNTGTSTEAAKKARLSSCAPILLVRDIHAAAAYWRDKVGFEDQSIHNDPPDFCIARRDGVTIMLALSHASPVPHWRVVPNMWNAYIWVDDAKSLYEELCNRGAKIDYTLHQKPYGCLEFGIQDLDGHDIAFGQVTH